MQHFFQLRDTATLHRMKPIFGFGDFGEIIYYRTYSRLKADGTQEQWADTVIRVINGVMSIRKDWYIKNKIHWDENFWQEYAQRMAVSLFRMEWLPPGRGLWAMGTELIYTRGAMALYNCAYTRITKKDWIDDLCWIMDTLMHGVGVGFGPEPDDLKLQYPDGEYDYQIDDTREGWVESLRLLLEAFKNGTALPQFDYRLIRPAGSIIRGFGGTASGPEPLRDMHEIITKLCYRKVDDPVYDTVRFKTDLANLIGVCVVTGNVRRSAEIAVGGLELMDLKNYDEYPYRESWGWMSNNTIALSDDDDFELLGNIANRVVNNGEPGYLNLQNLPFGRIRRGTPIGREGEHDEAIGLNPCGEIPLEHREVCNLAETLPTRCTDVDSWIGAISYATFYASTVALLPTHQSATNAVVARNRRIGISIIDFTGWKEEVGIHVITNHLRRGYARVREVNKILANQAGVPESLRVTTIKPGGTVPKIAGRKSGITYSNFTYMVRRVLVQQGTPFEEVLIRAGVPHEPSLQSKMTTCFEFPVYVSGQTVSEVTLWEQACNLILLQREWADNAVSNTLNFNPKTERKDVAAVMGHIAPLVKSVTVLPHTEKGVYQQMPEEGISKQEYENRLNQIRPIDWSHYRGDGIDEKYCTGEVCENVQVSAVSGH